MKKLTQVALAFAMATVSVGCGGEDSEPKDSEPIYTLTAGIYAVSNLAIGSSDGCERSDYYAQLQTFQIDVASPLAIFDLTPRNDPQFMPQSTIEGNSLVPVVGDPVLEAKEVYNGVYYWACFYDVVRTVSGTLTGDDQVSVQVKEAISLRDSVANVPECAALPYYPSCISEFRFTVTRISP